ncbi:MAG TPA: cytochrome c oxidase subunit II [Rhizomicrobium sp.]|nr:cytochrome c oxidase subunit II [Rhizomicrobium sp.]
MRSFKPHLLGFATTILFCAPGQAAPLEYLTGSGDKAAPVVALTWGTIVISLVVIAVITALLAAGVWKNPRRSIVIGEKTAIGPDTGGHSWLWIGVGLSSLVLLLTVVWTVVVLAKVIAPSTKPTVTIEITGKQWWWQAKYDSPDPARVFITANEIHIPAGEPVRLRLIGGDVIHSFWVPQLSGKTDTIPGQINETWLEAKHPGVYRGQCTEYCGVQHAHMGIVMVADTPAAFRRWWDHQLQSPALGSGQGAAEFLAHCGGCHTVRGTDAVGVLGPDLSHLMTRTTIAAFLPNDRPTLARWIADPQSLKPGSLMPTPEIAAQQRDQILAYLQTLR